MAMNARREAWKQKNADTRDRELKRAVWRANSHVQWVCGATCARFLENHVQGLEEELRQHDHRGHFQGLKSLGIKDTGNAILQYIRDEI